MQVDFYHLTRRPVDQVLPRLAERVVKGGERLLVVAADESARRRLDQALWSFAAESFLPHGCAGGANDAGQPVLIAAAVDPANGAVNVALADGVWRDEALGFARVFHLFGEEAIAPARAAWRALAERPDVHRRYWKQDDSGKWTQAG